MLKAIRNEENIMDFTPTFEQLKRFAIHELDDNRLSHSETRKFLTSTYGVSDDTIEQVFNEIN